MILYFRLMLIHIMLNIYGLIAQLVEQRTENPRVVGSIPTGGTILLAPESKQFDSDGRHQMRA